jgi:hypothetical protein
MDDRGERPVWILGAIQMEYGITTDGVAHLDQLGGSAAYAGAGARLWGASVHLVSRVTEPLSPADLGRLSQFGIETDAVQFISNAEGGIRFCACVDSGVVDHSNPAAHFLRIGAPLPKPLLRYRPPPRAEMVAGPADALAIRPADLPDSMAGAGGAHIAACAYFTQATVPARLRQLGVHLVTLDPLPGLMEPAHQAELADVLHDVDVFLPNEEQIASWSRAKPLGLVDAARALASMGPRMIVITCGAGGAFVWDNDRSAGWQVPAYPVKVRDAFGVGDVFAGGYLAGLARTGDPVEAGLCGCVAASMALEGSGAAFPLKSVPGLADARCDHLRPAIRRV